MIIFHQPRFPWNSWGHLRPGNARPSDRETRMNRASKTGVNLTPPNPTSHVVPIGSMGLVYLPANENYKHQQNSWIGKYTSNRPMVHSLRYKSTPPGPTKIYLSVNWSTLPTSRQSAKDINCQESQEKCHLPMESFWCDFCWCLDLFSMFLLIDGTCHQGTVTMSSTSVKWRFLGPQNLGSFSWIGRFYTATQCLFQSTHRIHAWYIN